MWKTRSRVWAQIGPFTYILPPKTADIHCSAVDFALFRKPYVSLNRLAVTTHCSAPSSPLVKIERNEEASTFLAEGGMARLDHTFRQLCESCRMDQRLYASFQAYLKSRSFLIFPRHNSSVLHTLYASSRQTCHLCKYP